MVTSRDENKQREAARNDPRQLAFPFLEADPDERNWYYDGDGTKRYKENGYEVYQQSDPVS